MGNWLLDELVLLGAIRLLYYLKALELVYILWLGKLTLHCRYIHLSTVLILRLWYYDLLHLRDVLLVHGLGILYKIGLWLHLNQLRCLSSMLKVALSLLNIWLTRIVELNGDICYLS